MARLHHVSSGVLTGTTAGASLPTRSTGFKATPPAARVGVEPWFSLTPGSPTFDTRVSAGDAPGVAATLESWGAVTGPDVPHGPDAWLVLGGHAVVPGTPAPAVVDALRKHSVARIAVTSEELAGSRQILVLVSVRSLVPEGDASVQVLLGTHMVGEDAIARAPAGDDRIAVLIDALPGAAVSFELSLRLAGAASARLAVLGVAGHLL